MTLALQQQNGLQRTATSEPSIHSGVTSTHSLGTQAAILALNSEQILGYERGRVLVTLFKGAAGAGSD